MLFLYIHVPMLNPLHRHCPLGNSFPSVNITSQNVVKEGKFGALVEIYSILDLSGATLIFVTLTLASVP